MSDIAAEQLYEYDNVQVSGMVEYGASLQPILAGETLPPPGGLRLDVAFGGPLTGGLNGSVLGVDYLNLRADGRLDLDIKGEITIGDGEKTALAASGVAIRQGDSMVFSLRENVQRTTASASYSWVNPLQIWGTSSVDLGSGKTSYMPE